MSLALYRADPVFDSNVLRSYGQIARRQLARRPIWILALAVFVITTVEADHFRQDSVQNSTFKIMFEIASASCGSGVSVGWPDENYSFSGGWHDLSKVILCAVMLRGRHRDIPDAIEQFVLLPSDLSAAVESERPDRSRERAAAQPLNG
jgi:Trk-type K+ transport system membrane component